MMMSRRRIASAPFIVFYALVAGAVREQPGRVVLTVAAIALGVALGVAVHLVNSSALNEFELAAHQLAGEADVIIRGPREGFEEALYPRIAKLPQVESANPALELQVLPAGEKESFKIIGLDVLRAMQMQPGLLSESGGMTPGLFDADAILLSHAAAHWLNLKEGDALPVLVGTRPVQLTVSGLLPAAAYRQRLGVMDIAAAQWRLDRLGRLNRIDVRLRPGTDITAFRAELQAMLPPGVHALTPEMEGQRGVRLTRAYRLNLDMLALIALFTGAFLVFSSQALALLRRRPQLALLRAIGLTRRELGTRLIAEGALVGVAGSAVGIVTGYALARYTLAWVGGDLGAGYFRAVTVDPVFAPGAMAAFFFLGVLFAVAGAAAPAWEAARRAPARALRAGDEEDALRGLRKPWGGMAAIVLGLALAAAAPPVDDLPVAGYSAIALMLLGTVLLMPSLTAACLERMPQPRGALACTAIAQLKAVPRQAAISVAAIVISLSLMASMLIMVNSFRTSLDAWLTQMLPADLYLRAARSGETGYLTPQEQARIASLPGVQRIVFVRSQNLLLSAASPPVSLIARPISPENAAAVLPLQLSIRPQASENTAFVWISEAVADLYGWRPGDKIALPIGGVQHLYMVAGIWRDYARQNGAIVIDRDFYTRLTGDHLANEAMIWLEDASLAPQVQNALRAALESDAQPDIATTREVRSASLAAFDRTFAITYALEIAAIMIGLFGVSVSFGAQAFARRREFGVLRHIGITRREIGAMLAGEGALVAAMGAACGLVSGWMVGLVLIHVVNRQSFHWSMELAMPWSALATLAAVIVAAAALAAVWGGRAAMRDDAVRAVKEDW
jgi:putative ABC transport system permease protein